MRERRARASDSGASSGERKWDFIAPDESKAKATFDTLVQIWTRGAIGGAGSIGDSAKALKAIAELPDADHDIAIERAPRYLRSLKDAKKSYTPAIFTFVQNREFDHHPPPAKAEPGDIAPVSLGPFVKELWALLWRSVHKARQAGADHHRNRLKDTFGWVERGVTLPAATIPSGEEAGELVAVTVGSPEHAAWMDYATRVGLPRLPRPDHVPVIWTPAAWPPTLSLTGVKPYALALPVSIRWRSPEWWWRLWKRLEDGSPVVTRIGSSRIDLLEGVRTMVGAQVLEFGPLPLAGEIAALVEVKNTTHEFESWRDWLYAKGGDIAMWPDPSIWCPSETPALDFGRRPRAATPDYDALPEIGGEAGEAA